MDQCSLGTTSHRSSRLLANQRRHDLNLDLDGLEWPVLDRWRLGPNPSTTTTGQLDTH
jgi:hypothetical protein